MAPIGSAVYPPVTVSAASDISITLVEMTLPNTEYSHLLQNNLQQLLIRTRSNTVLKISFSIGETSTNYWSIPQGSTLAIDGLSFSGKTLYLQSSDSNITVEVMELYT